MTEVLIKRLSNDVKLPKYETDDSSGMDLKKILILKRIEVDIKNI